MNPGPPGANLNSSITAAWAMQSQSPAVRKRVRKTVGLNSPVTEDGTSTPAGSDGTMTPAGAAPAGESSTAGRERPTTERDSRKKRVRRTIDDSADKYAPPDARLSQLGGLGSQVTQLLETVALPLLHPEIYSFTGVPRPKGVLLHGVPGGGKTQLVRCLAGELGLPFITVSAPSIVSGMSGESERALRETFDEAKVGACELKLLAHLLTFRNTPRVSSSWTRLTPSHRSVKPPRGRWSAVSWLSCSHAWMVSCCTVTKART
jgi:ribosome biogenesis ATPase